MNHQSPQLTQAFKLKGYLDKKSSQLLVGWQSRFWTVVGIDLLYYQDNTEKDLKGRFTIKKMISIEQQDKKILTFIYDDRKYELKAANTQDRDKWVKGLRAIKKYVGEDVISQPNSPTKLPQTKSTSSLRDLSDILSGQQEAYIIIAQQMQEYKSHSDVIRTLGLKQMATKFSNKKIFNRIAITQTKDSYLIVFSCKSIVSDYQDGEILSQEQVNPFQLNTLYRIKIGSQKVRQVCKTSSIFSVQYDESLKILKINCGKRLQFLLKQKDKDNKNLPFKLKKAAEIGRQYHNSKNISLNTNIGPLIKLYETNQGSQLKQKSKIYLQNKYSTILKSLDKDYTTLSTFSEYFQQIILFQKDYLNAFEVSSTKNSTMISDFQEFIHNKIHKILTQYWNQRNQTLSSEDILQFARMLDQYRRLISKYAKDYILQNGISVLVKIYLRSLKQKFFKQINKLRSSLSSNNFSNQIYNFLYRETLRIILNCQSHKCLVQTIQFIEDCYKTWVDQMILISQKQANPENLINNYIEIYDFHNKIFGEFKTCVLNNGLDLESFDDALNQQQTKTILKDLSLNIIQRLFKILFSNIDRNIIVQPLMKMDLQLLIKEIDIKINGLKNVPQDLIKQIRKQIAKELLQFELNLIIDHKIDSKDSLQTVVKKITNDKSIIERQYLKTITKNEIQKQVQVLNDIIEFLASDSLISITKHFKSLQRSLPCLFTLVTAKNLIEMKNHLSKQERSKMYSVCMNIISSDNQPSEVYEPNKKQSMLQSYALSSRRSTLTLSLQKRISFRPKQDSICRESISGYLKKKKVDNRSIKRVYERRYFTILEGHLLWYLNQSSVDLHNKIDLKQLKLVGLHETKKDVFFLHLEDCIYQFKADTPQLCKEWVRVLKSYLVADTYENQAITINDHTQLFKDNKQNIQKSAPKLIKLQLQSTRDSVLTQLTDKSKLKDRNSPSPSSPPKSPTKSVISKAELQTERNANAPFIKKESLNVEQVNTGSRGCWGWFMRCLSLQ